MTGFINVTPSDMGELPKNPEELADTSNPITDQDEVSDSSLVITSEEGVVVEIPINREELETDSKAFFESLFAAFNTNPQELILTQHYKYIDELFEGYIKATPEMLSKQIEGLEELATTLAKAAEHLPMNNEQYTAYMTLLTSYHLYLSTVVEFKEAKEEE